MSEPCPGDAELIRFLDGESTRNRGQAIADHLEACPRCRASAGDLRQLASDLGAPIAELAAQEGVARIMASLDRVPPRARHGASRRRWGAAGGGLAAAAALLIVLSTRERGSDPAGAMQARGGAAPATLARLTGVTICTVDVAATPPLAPLREGATIRRDRGLTATYRNLSPAERPVFLLVFAVDAEGAVHWIHPGYGDASSDPAALRLAPATRETPLAESAVLDHPAAGPLRILSLATHDELRVSAIDPLGSDALSRASLSARFPAAAIRELRVVIAE